MRIIKQGVNPAERTYRVTCQNCKTVFEFMRNEARFSSDQREGDCLLVDCPVCKQTLFVPANSGYAGPG